MPRRPEITKFSNLRTCHRDIHDLNAGRKISTTLNYVSVTKFWFAGFVVFGRSCGGINNY